MTTISSPRVLPASGASTPTVSSRRTSLDTTRTSSPAPRAQATSGVPTARRNRAALRDYYNLKTPGTAIPAPASPTTSVTTPTGTTSSSDEATSVAGSELDKPGFDASAYVQNLLSKEGLAGILKAEGSLLNEIRELDGERKALVYDNYSKLIAATNTIRGMRGNMRPLGSSTGELKGMIERISGTVGELAENAAAQKESDDGQCEGRRKNVEKGQSKGNIRQRQTVRWVVDSPRRFRSYIENGDRNKAEQEWGTVQTLLAKWSSVDGVKEVQKACLEALKDDEDADNA